MTYVETLQEVLFVVWDEFRNIDYRAEVVLALSMQEIRLLIVMTNQ